MEEGEYMTTSPYCHTVQIRLGAHWPLPLAKDAELICHQNKQEAKQSAKPSLPF